MMKNLYTGIIPFIVLCSPYKAQAQLMLGIRGGINYSHIAPQITSSEGNLYGYRESHSNEMRAFYSGLFTRLKFRKAISIMLAFNYIKSAYEQTKSIYIQGSVNRNKNTKIYTTLNILELQSLFIYGLPLGSGKMNIGVGGNACYPISGEIKSIKPIPALLDQIDTVYSNISSKKINPGISAILKYEFNFGLFVEANYDYLFKAQPDINLSVFSIGTGFIFQFKKKRK